MSPGAVGLELWGQAVPAPIRRALELELDAALLRRRWTQMDTDVGAPDAARSERRHVAGFGGPKGLSRQHGAASTTIPPLPSSGNSVRRPIADPRPGKGSDQRFSTRNPEGRAWQNPQKAARQGAPFPRNPRIPRLSAGGLAKLCLIREVVVKPSRA